jgi:hypothetical protein
MCQKREDGKWEEGPTWIRTLIDTGLGSDERRTAIKNALLEVTIPLPNTVQGSAYYVPPLSEIQVIPILPYEVQAIPNLLTAYSSPTPTTTMLGIFQH